MDPKRFNLVRALKRQNLQSLGCIYHISLPSPHSPILIAFPYLQGCVDLAEREPTLISENFCRAVISPSSLFQLSKAIGIEAISRGIFKEEVSVCYVLIKIFSPINSAAVLFSKQVL